MAENPAGFNPPEYLPEIIAAHRSSAEAFDADGYYRMGDLATLTDPADPAQGVFFSGRLADQFKLSTGSWVFGAVDGDDV